MEVVRNSHKGLHLRCYSGPRPCLSRLIINISFISQLEGSSKWSQIDYSNAPEKKRNNYELLKTNKSHCKGSHYVHVLSRPSLEILSILRFRSDSKKIQKLSSVHLIRTSKIGP